MSWREGLRNDRKSDSNLNSYLCSHLAHSWCRVAAACATAPSLKQSSVEDNAICFGEFLSLWVFGFSPCTQLSPITREPHPAYIGETWFIFSPSSHHTWDELSWGLSVIVVAKSICLMTWPRPLAHLHSSSDIIYLFVMLWWIKASGGLTAPVVINTPSHHTIWPLRWSLTHLHTVPSDRSSISHLDSSWVVCV